MSTDANMLILFRSCCFTHHEYRHVGFVHLSYRHVGLYHLCCKSNLDDHWCHGSDKATWQSIHKIFQTLPKVKKIVGKFFLSNLGRLPFGGLSLNLVQRKLLLITDSQHFSVLPILDLFWFWAQYIFINLETKVDPQSTPLTPWPRSQVDQWSVIKHFTCSCFSD